jgi:hypothetical protein
MMDSFSIAQKMKWASNRKTTREEYTAYCLMGLFDVNMPLLYGEGMRAFYRLQEAILGRSSDHSILAFRPDLPQSLGPVETGESSLLTRAPCFFRDDVHSMHMPGLGSHATLSGTTLSVEMLICPVKGSKPPPDRYFGILDCSIDGDPFTRPAILLSTVRSGKSIFRRDPHSSFLRRLQMGSLTEASPITDHISDFTRRMFVLPTTG